MKKRCGRKRSVGAALAIVMAVYLLVPASSMASFWPWPDPRPAGDNPHVGITLETKAIQCAPCHQQEYNEWKYGEGSDLDKVGTASYHAISSTEESYVTGLANYPVELQAICEGCHTPTNPWVVEDKVNGFPAMRTVNRDEGVNCIVCHFDDGRMVSRQELQDPEFCATCHNDNLPLTTAHESWIADYDGNKDCLGCHYYSPEDRTKHRAGRFPRLRPKGSHAFPGTQSFSLRRSHININLDAGFSSQIFTAGVPFDVAFEISNPKGGHMTPSDPLRLVQVRVSVVDSEENVVDSWAYDIYRRSAIMGENEAESEALLPNQPKYYELSQMVSTPGSYTLKVEISMLRNRIPATSEVDFITGSYTTFTVE